jgi:hypothetical protein
MPKINEKKDKKKEELVVLEGATPAADAAPIDELDPEIAAVLESKRKKKTVTPADVDYIPELERDVDFLDTF